MLWKSSPRLPAARRCRRRRSSCACPDGTSTSRRAPTAALPERIEGEPMVKIMSMKTAVGAGLLVLGMTAGCPGVTYAVQNLFLTTFVRTRRFKSPCGRVDRLQRLARRQSRRAAGDRIDAHHRSGGRHCRQAGRRAPARPVGNHALPLRRWLVPRPGRSRRASVAAKSPAGSAGDGRAGSSPSPTAGLQAWPWAKSFGGDRTYLCSHSDGGGGNGRLPD